MQKSIEKNEAQLEELDGELEQLRADIAEKTQAADSVRAKVEEAQHLMDSKAEERDELKAQLDERSESANSFRALEMEIKQKLEDNERYHVDAQKRLQHWQEKMSALELHHIDEESDDEEEEGEDDGKAVKAKQPLRSASKRLKSNDRSSPSTLLAKTPSTKRTTTRTWIT